MVDPDECLLQQWFHVIPLDPANYYLDSVPMQLGAGWLIVLNVTMFLLSMLMMLMPFYVLFLDVVFNEMYGNIGIALRALQ